MKGKIDENGSLNIFRGKRWKRMDCRMGGVLSLPLRMHGTRTMTCGDDCPLFSEPEPHTEGGLRQTFIEICGDKWLQFTEFKDER